MFILSIVTGVFPSSWIVFQSVTAFSIFKSVPKDAVKIVDQSLFLLFFYDFQGDRYPTLLIPQRN